MGFSIIYIYAPSRGLRTRTKKCCASVGRPKAVSCSTSPCLHTISSIFLNDQPFGTQANLTNFLPFRGPTCMSKRVGSFREAKYLSVNPNETQRSQLSKEQCSEPQQSSSEDLGKQQTATETPQQTWKTNRFPSLEPWPTHDIL